MAKVKVYYNNACPVCAAGIRYQQRKLLGCGASVKWIDVHSDNGAAQEVNADLEFVRERLHLIDNTGNIRVGSEAFLALWTLNPRQRWLANLFGLPIFRSIFRWSYNRFAAVLYRWNRSNARW